MQGAAGQSRATTEVAGAYCLEMCLARTGSRHRCRPSAQHTPQRRSPPGAMPAPPAALQLTTPLPLLPGPPPNRPAAHHRRHRHRHHQTAPPAVVWKQWTNRFSSKRLDWQVGREGGKQQRCWAASAGPPNGTVCACSAERQQSRRVQGSCVGPQTSQAVACYARRAATQCATLPQRLQHSQAR